MVDNVKKNKSVDRRYMEKVPMGNGACSRADSAPSQLVLYPCLLFIYLVLCYIKLLFLS